VHNNPESATEIEAMDIPNFESIKDVPGPVDYVVINTPRRLAVSLFRECVEAGVGAVSYYTSGFAETDAEGLAIQEQLAAISLESHVPLFGPNCLGIYNPARGMFSSSGEMPFGTSGPVGVVSQSGTHGGHLVRALDAWYGVRVARGISMGNGAVLDAADWIEYIGEDDRVEVLATYVEGVGERASGDYERFAEALGRLTARKPVVIWKGGSSVEGSRVTGNHTGAKPIMPEDWARIMKSTGAIPVDSMEALVDTTAMLVQLRELRGPRAGLIVLTGGQGPAITDVLATQGLRVPAITQDSIEELATYFNPIGGSFRNPLDAAYATETPAMLARNLDILDRDPNIDFVIMDLYDTTMPVRRLLSDYGLWQGGLADKDRQVDERFLDVMVKHTQNGAKPFFLTISPGAIEYESLDLREFLKDAGVLAIPSARRAAVAYGKALQYWDACRAGTSPVL
jgi:acetyl-CoA synthetase (ADP-forming)/acetyltransferase